MIKPEIGEPDRVKHLPLYGGVLRIPFFVTVWHDGKPDFRPIELAQVHKAIKGQLCWICGRPLGRNLAFVTGPMCVVNRTSAEPPQHLECAKWAACVCPFMSDPERGRRSSNMPDGVGTPEDAPGIMLTRNPGVVAVYITRSVEILREAGKGCLFRFGEPREVLWYTEGRRAAPHEARAAMDAGLPELERIAFEEGPAALEALAAMVSRARLLLPA